MFAPEAAAELGDNPLDVPELALVGVLVVVLTLVVGLVRPDRVPQVAYLADRVRRLVRAVRPDRRDRRRRRRVARRRRR